MPLPELIEVYRVQWWAEGGLIEEALTRETVDGFVFLCEQCGLNTPWGVKFFPNRATIRFYTACRNHPAKRYEIPGSMILWFVDEMKDMPETVILREFDVHLAYYTKETTHATRTQEGDTFTAAPA